MYKVIKVTPYFSERLGWGQKLADFGFQLPTDDLYGEAGVISALDNGMSYIANGSEAGVSLKTFFLQIIQNILELLIKNFLYYPKLLQQMIIYQFKFILMMNIA